MNTVQMIILVLATVLSIINFIFFFALRYTIIHILDYLIAKSYTEKAAAFIKANKESAVKSE